MGIKKHPGVILHYIRMFIGAMLTRYLTVKDAALAKRICRCNTPPVSISPEPK